MTPTADRLIFVRFAHLRRSKLLNCSRLRHRMLQDTMRLHESSSIRWRKRLQFKSFEWRRCADRTKTSRSAIGVISWIVLVVENERRFIYTGRRCHFFLVLVIGVERTIKVCHSWRYTIHDSGYMTRTWWSSLYWIFVKWKCDEINRNPDENNWTFDWMFGCFQPNFRLFSPKVRSRWIALMVNLQLS